MIKSHGEIVSWKISSVKLNFSKVAEALRLAGLDDSVVRKLSPRHAFTRAARKLEEGRVIHRVKEDDQEFIFQFTQVFNEGDHVDFRREAILTLDKSSGRVSCGERPELAERAQLLLDDAIETKTAGDISSLVKRMFEQQADLFPMREGGGVYFVPAAHAAFAKKVASFLTTVNGSLRKIPVAMEDADGDKTVSEIITEGLDKILCDYREAIAEIDAEGGVSSRTQNVWEERLQKAALKLELYQDYLGDELSRLQAEAAACKEALLDKIGGIEVGEPAPAPAKKSAPAPEPEADDPFSLDVLAAKDEEPEAVEDPFSLDELDDMINSICNELDS